MTTVVGVIASWGLCPAEATSQAQWRLSADPTVLIGSTDGPSSETFHLVRGAVTAPNGMIVVADGGSRELRVFTSAGRFVRSFGRRGDGPREFREIGWIEMCGGRAIVAFDLIRHRITKWDTEGSLLDEFAVEGPAEGGLPPYRVACGPSGTFVVLGWPEAVRTALPVGPYRPTVAVAVADERGRRQRLIGEFPGAERIRTENTDRPHPFGKSTTVRMGVGGVYVGTADSFAIDLIAENGERHTFGRDRPLTRITRRLREQWVDGYLTRFPPEQRAALRRSLLDSEYSEWIPAVAPAYAGFEVDRLGYVWVAPYVFVDPDRDVSVEWSVFDPSGELVATVMVSANFRPTEIAEDHLLGVIRDSMGVERVAKYTLIREP